MEQIRIHVPHMAFHIGVLWPHVRYSPVFLHTMKLNFRFDFWDQTFSVQHESLKRFSLCSTLCKFPLESPRKAMVCWSLTLAATAVRRAVGLSQSALLSTAVRLAMGLGVWSEPQGYAFRVFCGEKNKHRRFKLPPCSHAISSASWHQTPQQTLLMGAFLPGGY